jgi:hypothetical protein
MQKKCKRNAKEMRDSFAIKKRNEGIHKQQKRKEISFF